METFPWRVSIMREWGRDLIFRTITPGPAIENEFDNLRLYSALFESNKTNWRLKFQFFNRAPHVLAIRVIIWLVKKSSVFQKIVVKSQDSLRATTSLPAEIDAQEQNQKQKNSCDHRKRY